MADLDQTSTGYDLWHLALPVVSRRDHGIGAVEPVDDGPWKDLGLALRAGPLQIRDSDLPPAPACYGLDHLRRAQCPDVTPPL